MKRIVLVRHGESVWNKENLFTGWTAVDLSEKGYAEAREAGRTVFITSRSLSEMERICDRVAILHRGQLVAVERGTQLRARAIRVVEMRFADTVTRDSFRDIPNIRNLTIEGNKVRCVVQGEPDKLIKAACQYHITDLLSTQPSLEQVLADNYGIKTI